MLLTGRANTVLPIRNYSESDKPLFRLQYVEESISQWWNQFSTENFSSLIPRQKWFEERRNLAIGDIVLIRYEGKSKAGSYRLGVVREIEISRDGLVRTCEVEYSLLSDVPDSERHLYVGVKKKRIELPVQRLVLILPVEEQDILPGGKAVYVNDTATHKEFKEVKSVRAWLKAKQNSKQSKSDLATYKGALRRNVAVYFRSCCSLDSARFSYYGDFEEPILKKLFKL